jgi:hypothetical protein
MHVNSRRSCCGCLGFVDVGSWAIIRPTTINNENGKTN